MKKILKLNNVPILNFVDLQKEFSPMEIYRKSAVFYDFASVHCLPLQTHLTHKGDGNAYVASYFTKSFWLAILEGSAWDENVCDAEACLSYFVSHILKDTMQPKEAEKKGEPGLYKGEEEIAGEEGDEAELHKIKEEIAKEAKDLEIVQKLKYLQYVCETIGVWESFHQAPVFLAIFELSEKNVLKVEMNVWRNDFFVQNKGNETEDSFVQKFPYETEAVLATGNTVYKYEYFDDEQLSPGAVISTVRVEAKGGNNQYTDVIIELHSEKMNRCVERIVLHRGECRYCNVSQGKIIRFLPSAFVSGNMCIRRTDLSNDNIKITCKGEEEWEMNLSHVSVLSAGSVEQGFLFVQDGKVNSLFYKPAENYRVKLRLDMIRKPVAEVKIGADGYEILLNDGTVVHEKAENEKSGIVSLEREKRHRVVSVKGHPEYREIVLSEDRKGIVILADKEREEMIKFFDSPVKCETGASANDVFVSL